MKKLIPRINLLSDKDQGVDFVELFFDLVFVYAITRVTALTAHNLDLTHTLQSVLIFWLIWWGWTQFTWSLNAANTKTSRVRIVVLAATGVAFVMAFSVDQAFSAAAIWFALPYVVIRGIGLGLYSYVTLNTEGSRARVLAYSIPSIVGLAAVLVGALVDPSQRVIWWVIAIGFDMLAGYFGTKAEGWDINPRHFAERHGLIVIIALGESLIVAAQAMGSQDRSTDLILIGGLAVLVTCLLWWSYFSWINEHLEEHLSSKSGKQQASLGRDAYSILHFPLIFGIIGMAVGFEKILGHPHDALSLNVAAALGGGYFLFVGSTAFSAWRLSGSLLLPRLLLAAVAVVAIVLLVGQAPYLAFVVIASSLILITVIEWKQCPH